MAEGMSNSVNLDLNLGPANGAALPAGGERINEDSKKCENGSKLLEEDNVTEEKRVAEKGVGNNGSFFDCCICLDLSKDPVVTNCGHLYCWSCLYHWLQVSHAKECPVCKGEVSLKTVTPIYGRGKNKRDSEVVSDTKIPPRPQGRRRECLRATLQRSGYLPTDIIRHLQDRLVRETSTGERSPSPSPSPRPYLNRFMTSRGVRAEQNQSSAALVAPSDVLNDIDRISDIAPEIDEENRNRRSSRVLALRRYLQAQRPLTGRLSSFTLSSAERLMDTYLISHALGRNQEQNYSPSVGGEDRDSFSSIVGVINSESQVDNAAEIDSMLTVSTSSSVRRQENGSRAPDVDSADSVPRRRRRLA